MRDFQEWRGEALEWAETVPAAEIGNLGHVQGQVYDISGETEQGILPLEIAEIAAWIAAMAAPAVFFASETRNGEDQFMLSHDDAMTWAGVVLAVSALAPLLATVRWFRRERRRNAITVGSPLFVAALAALTLLIMWGGSHRAYAPPEWPVQAAFAVLGLSAISLLIQFVGSPRQTRAERAAREQQLVDVRNEMLGILERRGILSAERRAILTPLSLKEFGDQTYEWYQHEQEAKE